MLKLYVIKILRYLIRFLPKTKKIKNLDYNLYMGELCRTDIVAWRGEEAKRCGMKVGENCLFFSLLCFSEPYLVEIGNNVIISGNVIFLTHDGAIHVLKEKSSYVKGTYGTIKIGDNCFIGMNTIILRNVTIGNNCIVGAGSVVRDSVPDNSVVMGNPAKVIFKTSMARKLLLNNKDTIKVKFENDEEKIAYLRKHFNLNSE